MGKVFEVGGNSMAPALARGARVLVAPLGREVRSGDVVVLQTADARVLHRVVLTFEEGGELWLVHRGDGGGGSAAAPAVAVVGLAVGSLGAGLAAVPSAEELAPRQRWAFRRAQWIARAWVAARRVARVLRGGSWPRRRPHPAKGTSSVPSLPSDGSQVRPAYNGPTVHEEGGPPTERASASQRTTEDSATLRIAPGVAWRLLDGEAAVVDLERGRTLGLNRTASLVWSMVGSEEAAMVDAVVARFQVDPETARTDVRRLLLTLRERGFLVEA